MRTHILEWMSHIHLLKRQQQPFFTVKASVWHHMYYNIRTTQDDGTHLVQKHKIHSAIRAVFVTVVTGQLWSPYIKAQSHLVYCIKGLIDEV